jgi:toluene monooxygenase system protein E
VSRHPPPLKTYSHLAALRRVPTEYEVVTSRLLYYVERGFEIQVPVAGWYHKYQRGSALRCGDWERFRDPRETTYTKYTALQSEQEAHLAGVIRSFDTADHDPGLDTRWHATFSATLAPLRFALHGFQMIAAYVGSMAPAGRITITALFQAADELRRVDRIAYRMGQLRRGGFGDDSRQRWQSDSAWQPLRRAVERALVTYDWAEAVAALNLCLKPMVEALFLGELTRLARRQQDFLVAEMLSSFEEDGRWHRAWSRALFELAFADRAENREVVQGFVDRWYPLARQAADALGPVVGAHGALAEVVGRGALEALGLVPP